MDEMTINGVILSPLKIIDVPGGDVFHAMKRSDAGFAGFGEAYFSTVKPGAVKAWKRHREMTLNIVVPVGAIRFVMFDDRPESPSCGVFMDVRLSLKNYCRLTVPPKVWMGFQGVGEEVATLLNIANMTHDPGEVDKKALEEIAFDWSVNT